MIAEPLTKAGNQIRVVYWTNIPTPYMVGRFNALADRGNLDLEVWFSSPSEPDRKWTFAETDWRFKYRFVPSLRVRNRLFAIPRLWGSGRPDIFVTIYTRPSFLAMWQWFRLRRVKTAFWVLPTFDRWARGRPIHRALRRRLLPYILPRANAILTSGSDGARFALEHGAPATSIVRMSHPVDAEFFAEARSVASQHRAKVRSELRVVGTTFIYVGRFWWGKGLNYLIDAFAEVQALQTDASLLLVGEGPDEPRLRAQVDAHGVKNVMFLGFRQQSELPALFAAADVFVFPTLGDPYGHAVDEAMASSLPVISTTEAGEISSRIVAGINGFLVSPQETEDLTAKMLLFAKDHDLAPRMGAESARIARRFTMEGWAQEFESAMRRLVE